MINSGLNRFIPKLKNAPHTPVNKGVEITKSLFGESEPYVIQKMLNGDIVVFSDTFMEKFIKALSTNCIAPMGPVERKMMFAYMDYESGITSSAYSRETALAAKALDKWIFDEMAHRSHSSDNTCYKRATVSTQTLS